MFHLLKLDRTRFTAAVREIHWPIWSVPLALLVLSVLSFGLLLPSLGFYWDDWVFLLTARLQGSPGFVEFFQYDRPTAFASFALLSSLLGSDPVRWQVLVILLRWLAAVLLWWSLRMLLPGLKELPAWSAFLFLVYPVFRQQPIALTYHQHWLNYIFYLLSTGAMIAAVRYPRHYRVWTPIALLSLGAHLLTSEYFLGVEFLRPVILWLAISTQGKEHGLRQTLKSALLHWLPYLAVLLIYLAWRFFFLNVRGDDQNNLVLLSNLMAQPLATIMRLVQMVLQDISYILITNWYSTFQPSLIDLSARFNLIAFAVGLVSSVLCGIFLLYYGKQAQPASPGFSRQIKTACILGGLLLLLGPLPAWVTDRQVMVGAYSDRMAVPAMFGASLLIAGLIAWFIRTRPQQILIVSLLVGLAVASSMRNANDYRWASIQQNRFYWHLYWRAPHIQPQTAVFAHAEVLPKTGLYSTAAGINLIYSEPVPSGALPYWFFSISRQFGHRMAELRAGIPLEHTFRQFSFQGESANSLILYYDPSNADCLRVVTANDARDPALPALVVEALPVIKLSQILAEGPQVQPPSADIFGAEPEHGWCYFFEKADLARQMGDWQQVVQLAEQANARGFSIENSQSNTPQEWLPFIEGYAHSELWQEAQRLSEAVLDKDPKMSPRVCDAWLLIQESRRLPENIQGFLQQNNCQP